MNQPSSRAMALLAGLLLSVSAAAQPTEPDAAGESLAPIEAPALDDPLPRAFATKRGGLTADEVGRLAQASSPEVRASQAEIEAAAAKVDAAMISFFPRVTLAANYTRLSPVGSSLGSGALVGAQNPGLLGIGPCPTGSGQCVVDSAGRPVGAAPFEIKTVLDNYSLRASLSVPVSDYVLKLSNSIASVESARDAALLNQRAAKLRTAADAKISFYNWARGLGQVAVAEKSLTRTEARLKEARTSFSLGTATQADVLRLEARVASTEAAIEAARAFRDIASEQLRVVINDDERALDLGEDVLGDRPDSSAGRKKLADLMQEAYAKRPEVLALGATRSSLTRAAGVAKAGRLPRLDGFADYTYANPNTRAFPPSSGWSGSWQAGLNLTWVVNETFASAASAKELDANARRVQAQLHSLKNGLRLEVSAAYLELRKARSARESARRGVKASDAAYRVAMALYQYGKSTTTELIDAENELVAAQLQQINAHIDVLAAEVKLAHATGADAN